MLSGSWDLLCFFFGEHQCFKSDRSGYTEPVEGTLQWSEVGEIGEIGNKVHS